MTNEFNLNEKEVQDLIDHGFATVEGTSLSKLAQVLGQKGGQSKSEAKRQAAIANGKKGGYHTHKSSQVTNL